MAAVVEIVKVELAPLAPGVTVFGEKEQEEPAGKFEQESETALLKVPNLGARLIV